MTLPEIDLQGKGTENAMTLSDFLLEDQVGNFIRPGPAIDVCFRKSQTRAYWDMKQSLYYETLPCRESAFHIPSHLGRRPSPRRLGYPYSLHIPLELLVIYPRISISRVMIRQESGVAERAGMEFLIMLGCGWMDEGVQMCFTAALLRHDSQMYIWYEVQTRIKTRFRLSAFSMRLLLV